MHLFKMSDLIILSLSMANHKPKEQWETPIRLIIRSIRWQVKSWKNVV
jgi:hypothetical protein